MLSKTIPTTDWAGTTSSSLFCLERCFRQEALPLQRSCLVWLIQYGHQQLVSPCFLQHCSSLVRTAYIYAVGPRPAKSYIIDCYAHAPPGAPYPVTILLCL